jgi:hypothetical protein
MDRELEREEMESAKDDLGGAAFVLVRVFHSGHPFPILQDASEMQNARREGGRFFCY